MMRGKMCLFILSCLLLLGAPVAAQVSGTCANCHTMHNSQARSPMNFDSGADANAHLLKGTCAGCHAQGGAENVITIGGTNIPQVLHTHSTDLAAGNFGYIYGDKGSGASDAKGHNVIMLGAADGVISSAPGGLDHGGETRPLSTTLTCAGLYGCHGSPQSKDPDVSIAGAHHTTSGAKPSGDTVGNSYRFLLGITGLEATGWMNTDSTHHNEYKGDRFAPSSNDCGVCHGTGIPAGSSISAVCQRCHKYFHSTQNSAGLWLRHPTDVVFPTLGEYTDYTVYNVDAPVARQNIPDNPSGTVSQGIFGDVVTCISCHKAHATDYPDLLRWDYSGLVAGGGSSTEGCFICHSDKDE